MGGLKSRHYTVTAHLFTISVGTKHIKAGCYKVRFGEGVERLLFNADTLRQTVPQFSASHQHERVSPSFLILVSVKVSDKPLVAIILCK